MTVKRFMFALGMFTALLLGAFALQPSLSVATEKCECGEDKEGKCLPCDECDCGKDEKDECLPCKFEICHNIGGPRELGANCDGTGNCSFVQDGETFNVPEDHFLGIIIGFKTIGPALKAHLNHGDGFVLQTFDPALHLASEEQNHRAANVECFAKRAITTQPPEPGN
jgi:hypothetical protein